MAKRSIVQIEIPARDREVTGRFYRDLFGWDFIHNEAFKYTMGKAGNTGIGYPNIDDQNYKVDDVIIYIDSEDLQADMKAIEAKGGQIASEVMPVPGFGALVFFIDPAGNRLALWKNDGSMSG